MMPRTLSLAFFLLLVVAVSVAASGFEAGAWYYQVANRPAWTPPAWLFGPAWALAWLALALAGWQAWGSGGERRGRALAGWAALLAFSGAWSWLMFGLHRPGWAWLALGAALVLAFLCLGWFRALSRPAAAALAPFTAWMAFLWAWSLALWTLNGGFLGRFLA